MRWTRRGVIQGAMVLGAAQALGCATTKTGGAEAPASREQGAEASGPAKSQRILILGGTEFLGPALVDAARARGHVVTLFNRGKTRPELFPDLEKLRGDRDPSKGEGLKALEGRTWDAVIDTSGYFPRLVKASAELLAPHVGHYVFVSSISVYKDLREYGIDERSPVATIADPTMEKVTEESYGALKALCEQAAETAMPGRSLSVRPGLIVGPDDPSDRFTYWPVRVARGGEVLAPGDGEDPVQFIDVRDLAAWLIHGVERKLTGTFNATGPQEPVPMRALLDTCKQATGSDARFTWADSAFLTKQKVNAWSDMPVWISRTSEEKGMGRVGITRALAQGLTFRPTADTVRDTLAWFKTLPPARQAKLEAGIADAREREVLAAWRQQQGSAKAQ
ncbi:NAD-dependent epimerase/dehydratase family protein [Myxococcaceae bacterium JPH2]|nr:NAD-dependent epimerase/dehydratase family protein [Myxococcaceae bacterium JPH2]